MKVGQNKKKTYFLIIIIVVLLVIIITFVSCLMYSRIKIKNSIEKEITIEYGEILTKEMFLKDNNLNVKIDKDLSSIKEVGTYEVLVKINYLKYPVKITIKDTTPPVLTVHELTIYTDEKRPEAKDFVIDCFDLSTTQLEDINILEKVGTQDILITAKDIYGNSSSMMTTLTILEDRNGPVFSGLSDIYIEETNKIDLRKNVYAFDQRFGECLYEVDDSKVNYNVPGNYLIYYSSVDKLGNKTISTRKINIKAKENIFIIPNYPTIKQFPEYPNGCESAALYTLLQYNGVNVRVYQIVDKLKKGIGPYRDGEVVYGGNPELEFVGDPRDIHGYGVYQKPIIDVANFYKAGIVDYSGHSLNDVLKIVSQNKPVQVWISIGLKNTKVCANWLYKPTNEKIEWICNLHSVVIVGYSSKNIYVSDPYTGKIEKYEKNQFEKIYNLFGKRAIYYP